MATLVWPDIDAFRSPVSADDEIIRAVSEMVRCLPGDVVEHVLGVEADPTPCSRPASIADCGYRLMRDGNHAVGIRERSESPRK